VDANTERDEPADAAPDLADHQSAEIDDRPGVSGVPFRDSRVRDTFAEFPFPITPG
jgi:hypothetical protein